MKLERKESGSSAGPGNEKKPGTALRSRRSGYTTARINEEGCIVSFTDPGGQHCNDRPGEMLGKHWSSLCSDSEAKRLAVIIVELTGINAIIECYIGLGDHYRPSRVGRLRLERLTDGSFLWTFLRVSNGAFPPLSPVEMKTLLSHCFHSLRSPLTSASTVIQLFANDAATEQNKLFSRRCEHVLKNLFSLDETYDDCSIIAEGLTGFSADEAEAIDIIGFLTTLNWDCVPITVSEGPSFDSQGVPSGRIFIRRRPLHRLIFKLLNLCERFGACKRRINLCVHIESNLLCIRFSGNGIVVPETIAAVLRAPLILHDPQRTQSSFFFDGFVIGYLLRELGGTLTVNGTDSASSDITLKLPFTGKWNT